MYAYALPIEDDILNQREWKKKLNKERIKTKKSENVPQPNPCSA